LERRSILEFEHRSIPRDQLSIISRVSFRGGSYFPLFPDGPHVGLVRPFWTIHEVGGMEPGLWYYHPPTDEWSLLRAGHVRAEARHLSLGQEITGDASAVCWMMANLPAVMSEAGPDCYRIAHLEAGAIGQRLALAATSVGLGTAGVASYLDEEVRTLFGIERTGWEVLYAVAIGYPSSTVPPEHGGVISRSV
jgi:SagB-type dehydrogenase family enzyme